MFWNRKKKKVSEEVEEIEEVTETEESEEVDDVEFDEEQEEFFDEESIDETEEDGEEMDEEEPEKLADPSVCLKIKDLNQLAMFANKRGNGTMQFMTKKTKEVFELRDAHFRIAQVWGTVTMARECSPEEYARVMLAIDLRDNPDDFYILPGLTEAEIKQAIEDFCQDNFSENGKKYSKKPEKFTKLLKEQDCREAWDDYTQALVYDKLEIFCQENGIEFDGCEVVAEKENEDGAES